MTCPQCATGNRDDAKFCSNCGTALQIACRNCGTRLAPEARFCYNCGAPVAATAPAATQPPPAPALAPPPAPPAPALPAELRHLQQYIPPQLLGKLESARAGRTMAGERRVVTVLFCDVKGSTAMAEGLDPEEWAEIMNGMFKYLIEPVYRYEGTLARLMGDAILAFFGAPIAHEDDPQRAVLAGLDIAAGIQPYRAEMRRRYGLDLNVRIGINTGLVVVGEVGSDLRVEYTAMGDAVNVASRLEQAAEPGTVLISGQTQRTIAGLFTFGPEQQLEMKGKAEPVPAYRVLEVREGAVPTRGIAGLASPMVGRERELQALQARVDGLLAGQGSILSVIGEAGLGKSRLVAELRRSLTERGLLGEGGRIRWLEGRSLSYETTTPYAPFVHLLTECFGLRTADTDAGKMAKIHALVSTVLPDSEAEVAPFLGSLLGLKLTGDDLQRVRYLDPPALRGRIFQSVQTLVAALAAQRPLVLGFEDLHWVDPTSLELLTALLPLTESAPLCVVAVFRPNTQDASWQLHELAAREYRHAYTSVALQPLDEDQARTLVANLLEIEDLPERVRALILRKAEGNPFYVEEVIRSLLDAGLVVREDEHWRATREIENIAVPDTLAGVITARLDRLDDEARHAAQTAAVVGREFRFDVLAQVDDAPDTLPIALGTLQKRELVRERSRVPQRVFLFKHVLTQETAYASLLLSKRRALHVRVGECLETNEPERVHEIARHYLEARQETRALPFLVAAGETAMRAGARTEAAGYLRRALDIVQDAPDPSLARRAYEALGKTLEFSMDVPGAFENYHQMLHFAQDHGDVPMEVSALNKMSFLQAFMMGSFPEAESHLADAEQKARDADDAAGLYEMINIKCNMCGAVADFSGADRYMEQAIALGRRMDSKDQLAYGLSHRSSTLSEMGRYPESYVVAQEALRVSEEAGNLERQAEIYAMSYSFYHLSIGDLDATYRFATKGYEIATRIGSPFSPPIAAYNCGMIRRLRGEYEAALEWQERSVSRSRVLGPMAPFMLPLGLGELGTTCLAIGPELAGKTTAYHAEVLELLGTPVGRSASGSGYADLGFCALGLGAADQAADYFQRGLTTPSIQMNMMHARLLAGAALAALALGQTAEAARYRDEALQEDTTRPFRVFSPLVYQVAGQVHATAGDTPAALDAYATAERLAQEQGQRPIVWETQAAQAGLLAPQGRTEEAAAKRVAAEAVLEEIRGLFQSAELCGMFVQNARRRLQQLAGAALV